MSLSSKVTQIIHIFRGLAAKDYLFLNYFLRKNSEKRAMSRVSLKRFFILDEALQSVPNNPGCILLGTPW